MPFSLGFWAATKRAFTWSLGTITGTQNSATYTVLTNGSYFSAGDNNNGGTTYYYSSTGASWTAGTYPSSKEWKNILGNGSRIVAAANKATTGAGAYSTNGTTWTTSNLPSAMSTSVIYDSLWDGTRFLFATNSTTAGIIYTTDGSSWSSVDTGIGVPSFAFDGTSTYVALQGTSATSTGRKCTSNPTVAGNWSNITLPSSSSWQCVVYGNGLFLAFISNSDTYASSPDGTTWTTRDLGSASADAYASGGRNAYFGNGRFYYLTFRDSVNVIKVRSSADGLTWTDEFSYPDSTGITVANGWIIQNNKIIAVGTTNYDNYIYGA